MAEIVENKKTEKAVSVAPVPTVAATRHEALIEKLDYLIELNEEIIEKLSNLDLPGADFSVFNPNE